MKTLDPTEIERHPTSEIEEPPHTEVLRQLEAIASSSLFSKSKRYPSFLRYIVAQTLAGQTDRLKERTLGVEVFNRPSDYDTNADPVVRITAGEIRKRLAQYYQAPGHEQELRVDLPIGSYTPHFSRPAHDFFSFAPSPAREERETERDLFDGTGSGSLTPGVEADPVVAEPPPQRLLVAQAGGHGLALWLTLTSLLLVFGLSMTAIAAKPLWDHWHESGIAYFWNSVFHAEEPALIVVGVHSFGPNGKDISPTTHAAVGSDQSMLLSMTSADMIPISDMVSFGELTDLLTRYPHLYKAQSAAETTFGQLQPGPVVLLGGLDNFWTMRLTSGLRFRFVSADDAIVDAQHPGTAWQFDSAQSARSNSHDYAIVANFFDPQIEQRVLIAAGIGKSGTAAATSFLTNNRSLQAWIAQAKVPRGKNVELVISTEIVQGQQGPPHVIAWNAW